MTRDSDIDSGSSHGALIPMVFKKLECRFKQSQLQFDGRITHQEVSTLFQHDYSSLDTLQDRICRLMESNLHVPDAEIEKLLAIRKASTDRSCVYLRSWTLSANTLAAVITNLSMYSSSHPQLIVWQQYMHDHSQENIHIRYVGSTITSAITRHADDTRYVGQFFGNFIRVLNDIDSAAYENVRLYEFHRMNFDDNISDDKRDSFEQIAIAFFGLENLLNTQVGGLMFTYDPGFDAYNAFQQYQLSFFTMMNKNMNVNPDQFSDQLATWRQIIIEEGERLDRQCSSSISPTLISMLQQQALPATVQGHVVLVLVGTDISRHDFRTATPFFAAGRSGSVTKTLLCRQAAWAKGQKEFSLDQFQCAFFPFVNLFPWLDTINTRKAALHQLYEYFLVTRPLIVTGLGKHATSALFSNILHHHGCGHRAEGFSYINIVAIPRICHFLNDQWLDDSNTDDPLDENSFIVIGNLDAGYERYGERSVELIELMDITWIVTLLVSEITLRIILEEPSLPRAQAIHRVWCLIDPQSSTADKRLVDVYARAERLKNDYRDFYRAKVEHQPQTARNVNNALLSTAASARLAWYGFAHGAPHSDLRKTQVQRMWKMNIPPLHLHISRSDKEQWLEWAHGLGEDISFYASAIRHVGVQKHHHLLNPMKAFIPEGADESWLDDEANLTKACLAWGAAMKLYLPDDHFSSDNQKRRIARRWDGNEELYQYLEMNHGRQVILSHTHPVHVRWKDGANDIDVHIRFKAKMDAQSDTRCEYRITFAKSGIYLHKDHNQQPTFHFTIDDIDADPAVRRLWRHEMREQGHVIDDGKEQEPMLAGLPAFTAVTKANNRQKMINPNDALWLLKEFIDKQSPQHLNFHLAPPDLGSLVTGYDSFQQSFADFLHSNHQQHPYNQWWLAKIADESMKKEAKNIAANLLHLYPKSIKGNFHTFKKRYSNDHSNKKQCITIIIKQ